MKRLVVAGVDEAGRGCLAGPVYAAAVILNPAQPIVGLADSKQLSAHKRETLAGHIKSYAHAYAIAQASVDEIDTLNILRASLLAMRRAVAMLSLQPEEIWVDGNIAPSVPMRCITIVGGDASHAPISAASILAKTARDAALCALDAEFPQYGFAQHKGYGTKAHFAALSTYGVIHGIHRVSFAPVRAQLSNAQ